jgi:hypothetical protein
VLGLTTGYLLDDTSKFANRFYKVLAESFGMPRDIRVEEFSPEEDEKSDEPETPVVTGEDTAKETEAQSSFDEEKDL